MIEAYAFLAAFAVQILVVSVVNPARFIKHVRGWSANFGSERFAQLYPGLDYNRGVERFVTGFRAVNIVIVLVGLALLTWLFTVIQSPDWVDVASGVSPLFLFLQVSPIALLALYAVVRYHKVLLQPSQEPKRTASLQRRGLLDFVSPSTVVIAALSFVLFFPFAIYVDLYVYDNATLSKYCYRAMGSVVFVYLLNGFIIYKMLYGRKNPMVTPEGRVRTIGVTVKSCIYGSIAVTWFIVISSFVTKLQVENWRPFLVTMFVVLIMVISSKDMNLPPRNAESGGAATAH